MRWIRNLQYTNTCICNRMGNIMMKQTGIRTQVTWIYIQVLYQWSLSGVSFWTGLTITHSFKQMTHLQASACSMASTFSLVDWCSHSLFQTRSFLAPGQKVNTSNNLLYIYIPHMYYNECLSNFRQGSLWTSLDRDIDSYSFLKPSINYICI